MKEILIRSTLDGSMQPSLYRKSPSEGKRPLLVGLHTWSYDRFNQVNDLLPVAEEYDFNLILPEFRGPNLTDNYGITETEVTGADYGDTTPDDINSWTR